MNYRHVYHAGNFADVLKHTVLALVIEHLKLKPAPFRVIDTHAGLGRYDLTSIEAGKTGEWKSGIGRIYGQGLPPDAAAILAPYLEVIAAENPGGDLETYPGSPLIARRLMRPGDTLVVNELHPEDRALLEAAFRRDRQTKVMGIDGWSALKALLPPKERRGVVLVDPPFEEPGEFARLFQGLQDAVRRFATGTVILWFPIKDERSASGFLRDIEGLKLGPLLCVDLYVRGPGLPGALPGTGLVVLNPPYTLAERLGRVMPVLRDRLALDQGARFSARTIDAMPARRD